MAWAVSEMISDSAGIQIVIMALLVIAEGAVALAGAVVVLLLAPIAALVMRLTRKEA